MLSRIWKFTLAWGVMVAIVLQGTVAPALAVPYGAPSPTLAAATQLPQPDSKFTGKVGTTYKDSVPSYPQPIKAPADSPNVLLILLDDVGVGMTSSFGGPVPTPNLDKLAANGIHP
jgi:arylsulfatase